MTILKVRRPLIALRSMVGEYVASGFQGTTEKSLLLHSEGFDTVESVKSLTQEVCLHW